MKKLIVVRHGDYDKDKNLNKLGREQISSLTEKLRSEIGEGSSILILSSMADRALQSTKIIAIELRVPFFEAHKILWSDSYHFEDFTGVLKLIQSRKQEADVIIIITHLEYTDEFPSYFCEEEEPEINLGSLGLGKGEAVAINCVQKSYVVLNNLKVG